MVVFWRFFRPAVQYIYNVVIFVIGEPAGRLCPIWLNNLSRKEEKLA
jgi:hypothetical protein